MRRVSPTACGGPNGDRGRGEWVRYAVMGQFCAVDGVLNQGTHTVWAAVLSARCGERS